MTNWNDLYKGELGQWNEPAPIVFNSIPFFLDHQVYKILDLGCGGGRNIIPYLRKGFAVSACDISLEAIKLAQQRIKDVERLSNVKMDMLVGDMSCLPYSDLAFDAVVSISVINHGTFDKIKTTISNIKRVLVPGGFLMITVASKEHPTFGTGIEIDSNTYVTDSGIDAGLVHYFFDECSLHAILMQTGFSVIELRSISKLEIKGINDGHLYAMCIRQ